VPAIVENRSVLSCLKDAEKLHLLLGSISPRSKKETTNLYMEFVVDVPVVPAGAIVLKYSITPILF